MDRRAFLVGTAGGVLAAGPTLAGLPDKADVRIASYVTNLRDHRKPAEALPAGSQLSVERVRDRPYDPLTVAVLGPDGQRLGFLPRSHGQVLAPLLDAGLPFEATVSETAARSRGVLSVTLRLRAG